MFNIEYEIDLNDDGRPYVKISDENENKPEDKFLALELTRYLLNNVYIGRRKEFDSETTESLEIAITLLGQVGDQMAELLFNSMKASGEASYMMGDSYQLKVKTIDERNKLNDKFILYNNKIFLRQEGLKVLISDENKIYELKDGINNENWSINEF